MPVFMPYAPVGNIRWAESPASSTRPARYLSASMKPGRQREVSSTLSIRSSVRIVSSRNASGSAGGSSNSFGSIPLTCAVQVSTSSCAMITYRNAK